MGGGRLVGFGFVGCELFVSYSCLDELACMPHIIGQFGGVFLSSDDVLSVDGSCCARNEK